MHATTSIIPRGSKKEMTTSKKPLLQNKIQQHDRGLLPSVADPVRLWGLGANFVGGVSRQVEVVNFKLQLLKTHPYGKRRTSVFFFFCEFEQAGDKKNRAGESSRHILTKKKLRSRPI